MNNFHVAYFTLISRPRQTLTSGRRGRRHACPLRRLDEPQDGRPDDSPDGRQDVRSAEEAGLPRRDAGAADCGGHTAADGDCASAAEVVAEEAGVRLPDPMCRK